MSKNLKNISKSDKVNTPDDLNDYIKISNPSLWVVLIAIIIFLIGILVWGIFGKLYVTVTVPTYVNGGHAISLINDTDIDSIEEGKKIMINSVDGIIVSKSSTKEKISDPSLFGISNTEAISYDSAYFATSNIDIGNGSYEAEIVVDEVPPISFLFK